MTWIDKLQPPYVLHLIVTRTFEVQDTFVLSIEQASILFSVIVSAVIILICAFIAYRLWNIKKRFQSKGILLEITPPAFTEKTSYTTQQLFSVIHGIGYKKNFFNSLLNRKTVFSFEIASTKTQGIRYFVRTTPQDAENIKRHITSYLPHAKVKEADDYLEHSKINGYHTKVVEFRQVRNFAYPLEKQNVLKEHDPVAYITGMMTKLSPGELVAFQIVLSPTQSNKIPIIARKILRNEPVLAYLDDLEQPLPLKALSLTFMGILNVLHWAMGGVAYAITEFYHGSSRNNQYALSYALAQQQLRAQNIRPERQLSSFEQAAVQSVQEKIEQVLFEASIRALVMVKDKGDQKGRINGIKQSFAPFSVPQYQSIVAKWNVPPYVINRIRQVAFQKRLHSLIQNKSKTLLSVSEVADIYHFPYAQVTQTENIVKSHSKELPAPLSLKNNRDLQVIFGKNTYGGTETLIGQTEEERHTHTYILGRTGSGKTTLMYTMAKHDIESGAGLAFIDPHGDVAEDLLVCIPPSRKNDLIYVNPIDLKYPIGINILELTPGLDEDAQELEKEVVAEGVISLFRKVFSKDEHTNAHRIEYILRNTIYTAFTVEGCTIFTISKILTNPTFRKEVIGKLKDEDLKDFWKYEFGKAGDYQVVKMTQGVTAKVGRFLRSPTARRILEQEKSTINFDDIINQGKILICNFSQGKLGEDTSRLMGTTIMTKLQQAALKRSYIPENKRRTFYLYVDEFQTFASQSFTKMITEGRKYRMPLIIAEQSTSQQKDHDITNTILANATTIISFRSGNHIDEELMLHQFAPYLEKGEIMNLPRYRFFIKISAIESEEPFSGITMHTLIKKDLKKMQMFIKASQKNWAKEYTRKVEVSSIVSKVNIKDIPDKKTKSRAGFPEKKKS